MPPTKRRTSKARTIRRVSSPPPAGMGDELFAVKQELREAMGRLQDDRDVELVLALMQSRRDGRPGGRKKQQK